MNDDGILGAAFGHLGQTVKQAAKQVVKLPEEKPAASAEGSGEPKEKKQQWQSDEERIKFLRDLYGSAEQTSSAESPKKSVSSFVKPSADAKAMADKEEQKKLLELRSQLHKENYYDPTFNPVKNPPAGGEERPAEKVEHEKKKEMIDLQKKEEKKPPPLAVIREQNKTEQFRGASG